MLSSKEWAQDGENKDQVPGYIWNVMCVLVINAGVRMVRCHLWWCMVIRALETPETVACHEALRC